MARFFADDGMGLHYEIWAQGQPTLLYVPGWGDHVEGMRWLEPLADEGIGIVVYERRGTGHSDRPWPADDNYSVERLSMDAIELADGLGLERIAGFAGFDGAHQAVRLAAERPERMAGLALVGPLLAPVAERPMQEMWEGLIAKGMQYALRSVADLGLSNAVRPGAGTMGAVARRPRRRGAPAGDVALDGRRGVAGVSGSCRLPRGGARGHLRPRHPGPMGGARRRAAAGEG